jgi:aminoglycoside phosphotransferase (APT) family kinase protein
LEDQPYVRSQEAAADLARFVAALQRIDPTGGPRAGPGNFYRGVPLADRDASVRAAITAVESRPEIELDTGAVIAAWEAALRAPAWHGPPTWVHGDLLPGNLLAVGGRLTAVIDFGCLGVGDPAADLSVAWTLFSGESREVYRATLGVDDATWARGRGWALSSVGALPYYWDTNPALVAYARRAIAEVLADHQGGGMSST